MKLLRFLVFGILVFMLWSECIAAEWQWPVQIPGIISNGTDDHPQAFLWIPSDCTQVRGVMTGTHNMTEETPFENLLFQEKMSEMGVGLIRIIPGWDQKQDVSTGSQRVFEQMLEDFAAISGYNELEYVPIVPFGYSAMATYPWDSAAWNPERTLAVISFREDAPRISLTGYDRNNMEWRKRTIDGTPGLMIEGEYEWWEDRVNPALVLRLMYPRSCTLFLCDTGRGYFDIANRTAVYLALPLKKAMEYRLLEMYDVGKPVMLKKLNPENGRPAKRWHSNQKRRAKAAPFKQYKGDPHDTFWYFDKEMADMAEECYHQERGRKPQYLGFVQENSLLTYHPRSHMKVVARLLPEEDGFTLHLKAVFTDSPHTTISDEHSPTSPEITRICGPVQEVSDTTFTVHFYRMGMCNKCRTGNICLLTSHDGDNQYKSTVQELSFWISYRNMEGKRQYALLSGIRDMRAGVESVTLRATSGCRLPVYYYMKEGPAETDGSKPVSTPIPPRSKYPLKVTVVVW